MTGSLAAAIVAGLARAVAEEGEQPMKHVVQMSGGLSSAEAAMRVDAQHGTDNLWLVFNDTIVEDADLYRFLIEATARVYGVGGVEDLVERGRSLPGISEATIPVRKALLPVLAADVMARLPRLVWIIEGRTPWDVYRDRRFLGNSRRDPCSEVLKRKPSDRWREENCDPDNDIIYVGFGFNEQSRIEKLRKRLDGWRVEFPMDDPPYLTRVPLMQAWLDRGIDPPRLYYRGFKHNNCSGLCSKAGQAQNAKLLAVDPCLYGYGERQENTLRDLLGDVSMMSDRRGDGKKKPLTLQQFRKRLEANPTAFDSSDVGECSCFAEPDDEA